MEPATRDTPPGSLDAQVSERIRVIIARQMLEQQEIARRAGMTEATLSRKLRGSAGPWRLDELRGVADALGVPMSDLIPGVTRTIT